MFILSGPWMKMELEFGYDELNPVPLITTLLPALPLEGVTLVIVGGLVMVMVKGIVKVRPLVVSVAVTTRLWLPRVASSEGEKLILAVVNSPPASVNRALGY